MSLKGLNEIHIDRPIDAEELKKQAAGFTFLDGIRQGRPDYAATWYNWGFHSPYLLQDAFFLISGAFFSAFCLPALVVRVIFGRACPEALKELKCALQMLFLGMLKGFLMLCAGLFVDPFRLARKNLRALYAPQTKKSALLVIDLQNDFFPGGSLAVPEAEEVLPIVNELVKRRRAGVRYFASQDWHPQNHGSFASNLEEVPFSETTLNGVSQVAWPAHCVQGTRGAEFVEGLPKPDWVIRKGQDPRNDSYSALADNGVIKKKTKLLSHAQAEGIQRFFVCGVATDYCVRATVEDLRSENFEVIVIEDACRGVYAGLTGHAKELAYLQTKKDLETRGARFMSSQEVMETYKEQFRL